MRNFFPPISFATYVDAAPEAVYETLTTGSGWDRWFTRGTYLDLKKRIIVFSWKDLGPRKISAEETAVIVDWRENQLFSFSWHAEDLPHPTLVTLRLAPKGTGTILSVSDEGYPRSAEGERFYHDCATGWAEALTLLKVNLEVGYTYRNWGAAGETFENHYQGEQ